MPIFTLKGKDIVKAAHLLEDGQVVAVPTETVYGLAANALNQRAVTTVFGVKNRPSFDPLIVHSDCIEKLKRYVTHFPAIAEKLAEHFWPGPLTLLLPKNELVPDLVTAGCPTVAIRIPKHPLTLTLLKMLDFPLAAPSANPFGYISPTTADHVMHQLADLIPYVLDGGACAVGIESTIVGFPDGVPTIYRQGGISQEQIESVIGPVLVHHTHAAPGQLKSHYAPLTPLKYGNVSTLLDQYNSSDVGILSVNDFYPSVKATHQIQLAPSTGTLEEAATNLFAALRTLDNMGFGVILVQKVPEVGIGRAINDRLIRAAEPRLQYEPANVIH